jgi:capsid protein
MNRLQKLAARVFSGTIKKQVDQQTTENTQKILHHTQNQIKTYFGGSGGYSGSRYATSAGRGNKFAGAMSNSDTILFDHTNLRQKARKGMQDHTAFKSIAYSKADMTIGTGLIPKPAPLTKILGITPEAGEEWAEDVASRFMLWANSKDSDRTGTNNFWQNQHLYQIWKIRDNDIFPRFYYSKDRKLVNPLQIGFVDPNQIRGHAFTSTYMQFENDDGILRDKNGKETGYKVWVTGSDGTLKDIDVPAVGARSGRRIMLHGHSIEYAGQGRGITEFAHALNDLANVADFEISHILKAISQSSIALSVKPGKDAPAVNPFAGQTGIRTDAALQDIPTGENPDEERLLSFRDLPEAGFNVPGSVTVANLQAGEQLESLSNTAPVTGYAEFLDTFYTSLASSMRSSVEVVRKKFEQNYSSSRGALLLVYDVVKIDRQDHVADFDSYVWEAWLSEEIAAGRVKAPGWTDPVLRAAWLNMSWKGSPMPNIDPMKTQKSDLGYVKMGAQSLGDVAENLNGSDVKTNMAKLTREYKSLPECPIDQPRQLQATGGNGGQQASGENTDAQAAFLMEMMEKLENIEAAIDG